MTYSRTAPYRVSFVIATDLEKALTKAKQKPRETGADRLSRFIVAVVTCLGALGLVALLYFPLHYLK
ncbi:hypothetical protein EGT07_01860 [Herbaspirillum sp. HC18]|nr:hypothetical protein EGT07_01860 [Herbaspirillum sp. HC18]